MSNILLFRSKTDALAKDAAELAALQEDLFAKMLKAMEWLYYSCSPSTYAAFRRKYLADAHRLIRTGREERKKDEVLRSLLQHMNFMTLTELLALRQDLFAQQSKRTTGAATPTPARERAHSRRRRGTTSTRTTPSNSTERS